MQKEIRTLKIGIASRGAQRARMLAIARGESRANDDEPQVWFTSLESLAQVLSDRNRMLLDMISQSRPASIAELAALSGRARSNLWRTLRTMEKYRLVELRYVSARRVEPRLTYDKLSLDVHLTCPPEAALSNQSERVGAW
jgi:predicted transcriptional regulator